MSFIFTESWTQYNNSVSALLKNWNATYASVALNDNLIISSGYIYRNLNKHTNNTNELCFSFAYTYNKNETTELFTLMNRDVNGVNTIVSKLKILNGMIQFITDGVKLNVLIAPFLNGKRINVDCVLSTNTNGWCKIYIDGAFLGEYLGDTTNSIMGGLSGIRLYKDVELLVVSQNTDTDFGPFGKIKIETLKPISVDVTGWNVTQGINSDSFNLLTDNTDQSGIYTININAVQSFNFNNLISTTSGILAVINNVTGGYKWNIDNKNIETFLQLNSDTDSLNITASKHSAVLNQQIFTTSPDSLNWDVVKVNNIKVGFKYVN